MLDETTIQGVKSCGIDLIVFFDDSSVLSVAMQVSKETKASVAPMGSADVYKEQLPFNAFKMRVLVVASSDKLEEVKGLVHTLESKYLCEGYTLGVGKTSESEDQFDYFVVR